MSYDYRSKNPKSRDIWYPSGANPSHTGKSGRVQTPLARPPSTQPFNIPGYVEEIATRTYPFYKKYLPEQIRIPYDMYQDFKYNPKAFKKKLKFWLMYLQANEKIPKNKKKSKSTSTSAFTSRNVWRSNYKSSQYKISRYSKSYCGPKCKYCKKRCRQRQGGKYRFQTWKDNCRCFSKNSGKYRGPRNSSRKIPKTVYRSSRWY